MNTLSVRMRLALTMGLLILVISVVIWIYVPRKIEQEAIELIAHKAETLAQLTAFTIQPSIFFQDRAALEEALSGTRQDKDVAYVLVVDPSGRRLSASRAERANPGALARKSSGGGISPDGSLYEVMTPILDRDTSRELARLYIGISLARLRREILSARLAIGLLSAAILIAGLIAVALISNVLTKPLRDVAAGAGRIAAGDLSQRVPVGGDDEIGRLAASFNDMAARVAERDLAIRSSRDQLRLLSKRLLSVQEQERVRIAREVHDELGQALTALKIDLQLLARNSKAEEPAGSISESIDNIIDIVRRIASDLRPSVLDDLGVSAALEQQLRRLRESTGIKTTLRVEEEPELDMLTSVTLYRIAQEALANVVRHSAAADVEVALSTTEETAVLEIRDNGKGMTEQQIMGRDSLGLVGMRERAELLGGSVAIRSKPGSGTVVTATLPMTKDGANAASTMR